MAEFYFNGVDAIEASLSALAQMSDDEKWTILQAGAQAIADKLKEVLERLGLRDSGQLIDGVTFKRKQGDSGSYASVSSFGSRQKGYKGKRKHGKGSYRGDNLELIYLHEHGTPRMKASHPVETAAKESEDVFAAAVEAAYDEYLKSKDL